MVLNDQPMPVTLDVFEFPCMRTPMNETEWAMMITWCDQHVGYLGTDYEYAGDVWWFFRELDHMVAFQLAWS